MAYETEEDSALDEEAAFDVIAGVLEHEEVDRDCSISLTYVDDEEIRRLNREWRGVDAPTDVLSFECDSPDDPDLPEGIPVELGDIVIAPAFVSRQSSSFGTTFADEERLMLVHATLHLLGYDHMEDEDAPLMQSVEDAILSEMETDGTLTDVVLARHREEEL
ncbi:MAG: rRNA maturation RNase YbeY [Atopobiaceae bacterium]|nr:rRNA maturation RNase YbeY [Atopobiaceae bacterium]